MSGYNIAAAVAYADGAWNWDWWDPASHGTVNPGDAQPNFECAEFVARAITAGGLLPGRDSRGQPYAAEGTPQSDYATYTYPVNGQQYHLWNTGGSISDGLMQFLQASGWALLDTLDPTQVIAGDVVFAPGAEPPNGHVVFAVGSDLTDSHNDAFYHVPADWYQPGPCPSAIYRYGQGPPPPTGTPGNGTGSLVIGAPEHLAAWMVQFMHSYFAFWAGVSGFTFGTLALCAQVDDAAQDMELPWSQRSFDAHLVRTAGALRQYRIDRLLCIGWGPTYQSSWSMGMSECAIGDLTLLPPLCTCGWPWVPTTPRWLSMGTSYCVSTDTSQGQSEYSTYALPALWMLTMAAEPQRPWLRQAGAEVCLAVFGLPYHDAPTDPTDDQAWARLLQQVPAAHSWLAGGADAAGQPPLLRRMGAL